MSNIEIKDLNNQNALGADLFSDSESFLRDLSENEFDIYGGLDASPPVFVDTYPSPVYQVVLINAVVNAIVNAVLQYAQSM
jgi:hypothetical protein